MKSLFTINPAVTEKTECFDCSSARPSYPPKFGYVTRPDYTTTLHFKLLQTLYEHSQQRNNIKSVPVNTAFTQTSH